MKNKNLVLIGIFLLAGLGFANALEVGTDGRVDIDLIPEDLSSLYCAITGCTFLGNVDATGYNITAGTFFGDGSGLTGINGSDPSWQANYSAYNASWSIDTNTQLSESQVDSFVANNGYITGEYYNQSLNTTDNVSFNNISLACDGLTGNESCLNVTGNAYFQDIFARDAYLSANTLYIGDDIQLGTGTLNGTVLNITGANLSADYYYGSGQFLTDINLSGISFAGDTINASTLNADNFNGGLFSGTFNWTAVAPWLSFDGSTLTFNESYLQSEAEVVVVEEVINITTTGGVGSATTSLIDFEIKQITVEAIPNANFRFEASETTSGDIIDRNRKVHTNIWDIEKNYPINDTVDLDITSASPDSTFQVTIKYLDNFE